ncbi:GTP cyclohydrolase II [Neptunicoccus cionae]|uniref:GTP cyclohydrolase-2 n=1 Tax=Neptunicoccus cionae TaxID=2035344 RepID=A0A916VQD4_9RHOB|nr:GTP cyclohydrolase II [Amylibacter cionae]GGA19633.1 GTP cyclohydrolase-2 [Amylibacter cionae]
MPFSVTLDEKIARARADLRMGVPVVLREGAARVVVAAIETLSSDRLAQMRDVGDVLHIAITNRRAETLSAPAYDGDLVRIAVPFDAPATWVHAMADPSLDLVMPMKGPFLYLRDGSALVDRTIIRLCKTAGLLPGAILAPVAAEPEGLLVLDVAEIAASAALRMPLDQIAHARVPLHVSQKSRVHVYRKRDGGEEHYAIEVGQPARDKPVLSRLHSACFTGDVIGSLKCDCGPQLQAALAQIGIEGEGVLLYLNQEGRGIGLANKMRAYSLQDQGFDTVEANHRLGFEDDERDFRLGAEILQSLGFESTRLMTNNPAKVARMEEAGIAVAERVPLQVGRTAQNTGYLDTKAKKSGHLL